MDKMTYDMIKEKMNDGNGGNAFIFYQLFNGIQNLEKEFKTLRELLEPLCEEREKKEHTKGFFNTVRTNVSAWVAFAMLILNTFLIIRGIP
jgi:hypothetical protein